MAAAPDLVRGAVKEKVNVPAAVLLDVPIEGGVRSLVSAGIGVAAARPAPLLPVGNLAALDGFLPSPAWPNAPAAPATGAATTLPPRLTLLT